MPLLNAMVLDSGSRMTVSPGISPSKPRDQLAQGCITWFRSRSDIAPSSRVPELVRRHPVLGALSEADQRTLLSTAKTRNLKRRESLWCQGDHASTVVLVLEGYLKVWASLSDGSEALLEIVGPGECAGEISVIHDVPHDANLTALSSCRFIAMDAVRFRQVLHHQSAPMEAITRRTAERLRQVREQLLDIRTLSVRARLAKTLLALAKLSSAGNGALPVRLSQSELGAMAGVCREIVNKCLAAWRDAGWIVMVGGAVISFDVDILSAIPRQEGLDDADPAWGE